MTVQFYANRAPTIPAESEQTGRFPVQWGQTLSEIAQICGVSVDALMQANPEINHPDVIYADQWLRIPGAGPHSDGPVPANSNTAAAISDTAGYPGTQPSALNGLAGTPVNMPAHPGKVEGHPEGDTLQGSTERGNWYMKQPGSWQCGPTSLTMLAADLGVRKADSGTLNEMIGLTGAQPGAGVPGNASLIAGSAEKLGLHGKYNPSSSVEDVRAALQAGHKVILNGSLRTGGHFIYVAGIDNSGNFIIGDPIRPQLTTMTAAELQHFATHNAGQHPPGFAEIWR